MADFLANMVLRTLNPGQGVQPRLRTRFEPARAELAISNLFPSSNEPMPETARDIHTRSSSGKQRSTPAPQVTRTDSPRPSNRLEDDYGEVRQTHPSLRKQEQEIDGAPSGSGTTLILPEAMRNETTTLRPARQLSSPAVKTDVGHLTRRRVIGANPASSAVQQPVQGDITLEREPGRSSDTVHITIGRVEVRALVQSKPQPVRRASRSALMTLDEYLTRRKGGSS